jgi:hypothetical protein
VHLGLRRQIHLRRTWTDVYEPSILPARRFRLTALFDGFGAVSGSAVQHAMIDVAAGYSPYAGGHLEMEIVVFAKVHLASASSFQIEVVGLGGRREKLGVTWHRAKTM